MKNARTIISRFFLVMMLVLSAGFATAVEAQNAVSGTIKDVQGAPLPGVSILVQGTTNGTVSDMDGKYQISVAADAVLEFSFIGFDSQTVPVAGQKTIDVTLTEESIDLNEVVAIGYGVQRKSDLTGSVAKVTADDLKGLSTTDAGAALQGKAAGVQIINNSGAPGAGAAIRVRGYSSNSSNLGPLMIVDGLKVDNIQYLDPSMIASMEVLKDAASAAIYGAQAGNGVILITTKQGNGNSGKPKITYEFKATNQSLGKTPEIFGAKDWIAYKEASGFDMKTICESAGVNYSNPEETDWVDAVFGDSWATQHSLTFQDGNDRGHFFASVNYVENDGIVRGNKDTYSRVSTQVNADYKLYDWIKVSANNNIEKWATRSVTHQSAYGSMLAPCLLLDPLTPIYYDSPEQFSVTMKDEYDKNPDVIQMAENGKYYATSKIQIDDNGNPLLQRDRNNQKNSGFSIRGVFNIDLMPVDFLTYSSRFSYRIAQSNAHNYAEPYFLNGQAKATEYSISADANNSFYYQWENFLNFNKTIAEKNNIGAMVGMSFTEDRNDNVSASAQGSGGEKILAGDADNFKYLNYVNSAESTTKSFGNLPGLATSMSYFGRLTYSYDNRYSAQFNFRADAFDTSKLPAAKRWGKFPSVSAGWNVSNEDFFQDLVPEDIMSFLKVRASWGQNGNVDVLNNYPYTTTIAYNQAWYQYGNNPAQNYGSYPGGMANPDLKWETSEQVDFGLDMKFLSNRLSLGLDYYKKVTKDLLVDINPVPEVYTNTTTVNAGEVTNKGLEIELGWQDQIGDFKYSVNGNISTLDNKVTYLYEDLDRIEKAEGGVDGTNNLVRKAFEEGHSVWYFRAYDYAGVSDGSKLQVTTPDENGQMVTREITPKAGSALFRDQYGNITDNVSGSDMTDIGSPIPTVTYGLTINLAYKGFDFTVFGTGTAGNKIFNILYRADTPLRNSLKYFYENATTLNADGSIKSMGEMPDCLSAAQNREFWSSSASLFNGSYFKFKQIQLGYTLPKAITEKFACKNFRVFASLDDFFTISSYPGMDPETATASGNGVERGGFDIGSYPTMKKVVFGASIAF